LSEGQTFERIDPEEVAEKRRSLIRNPETGEYFIADYFGSEMARDTPLTERYFRVREYIKSRDPGDFGQEWLRASHANVWSSKFLGLAEDGFQKLEFQNPGYSAAFRLGGDPRHHNDTFVIQTNGCNFECSYCYVDRQLNSPELGKGKYFSVKKMLDVFLKERAARQKQGKHLNTIRLSGGEVTCIVPELILDVYKELERRCLSDTVYLWVDCNLSTPKYLQDLQTDLREIGHKKNFGMVGCLKTPGDGQSGQDDFARITKSEPEFFPKQFEVLDFLVNTVRVDMYVYLVPIIWGDRKTYSERLRCCAQRLSKIRPNLPLRTNVLRIRRYAPVEANMRAASREGRPLPRYVEANFDEWYQKEFVEDQKAASRIWFEETIPNGHDHDGLQKYRCQVPLFE
jgi:uncharacterized Fe-S cluster-containing radical SAM superfamily protein